MQNSSAIRTEKIHRVATLFRVLPRALSGYHHTLAINARARRGIHSGRLERTLTEHNPPQRNKTRRPEHKPAAPFSSRLHRALGSPFNAPFPTVLSAATALCEVCERFYLCLVGL